MVPTGAPRETARHHNKERKNMAELKEEHFLRIDENKDRILQSEKKKLQHQVLDLEMTLLKIKEVIREHEKSNDNK